MTRLVKMAAIVVFVAILGLSSRTSLAAPLPSGSILNGWTITYSVPGISLAVDPPDGAIQIVLEKTAGFTSNAALSITFTQTGFISIAPKIEIINESVTNVTGTNWTGFEFRLQTTSGVTTTFEGPSGIFVPPNSGPGVTYTSAGFSSTDIVYSGSQANGSTAFWGTTGGVLGGALIIDTHPTASGSPAAFVFQEIPAVVPLPAAAWQGLGGLLGLGLIGYARKATRAVA